MNIKDLFLVFLLTLLIGTAFEISAFFHKCNGTVYAPSEDCLYESAVLSGEKININTASREVLDVLFGIDKGYSRRILKYRKKHGQFQCIDELSKVQSFGRRRFLKIKENISVKEE